MSPRSETPGIDTGKSLIRNLVSLLGALASLTGGHMPRLGEQLVDHDTPLDPAKAMITSACYLEQHSFYHAMTCMKPQGKDTNMYYTLQDRLLVSQLITVEVLHNVTVENRCKPKPPLDSSNLLI